MYCNSYKIFILVTLVIKLGLNGLEPSTSRLSGVRSNQLSYKPKLETYGLSKLNNKESVSTFLTASQIALRFCLFGSSLSTL